MNINKLLVKRLQISSLEAERLVMDELVFIDNKIATQRQTVIKANYIIAKGQIVQEGKHFFYLAYHKPRGIESTQNRKIADNLAEAVNLTKDYFPLGRLDKESEGLMILTNDGSIYRDVTSSKVEKEYVVEVNKELTNEVIERLSSGVEVLGKTTLPCDVVKVDSYVFRIILKQGLNRQIRRMCYKLGYEVQTLKRIRIGSVSLDNLLPNEKRAILKEEIVK